MPRYNIAPLKGSFMLTSIIGFFIAVYLIKSLSLRWAWAIGFLCVIMFASSLISMTFGPAPDKLFLEGVKERAAMKAAKKEASKSVKKAKAVKKAKVVKKTKPVKKVKAVKKKAKK